MARSEGERARRLDGLRVALTRPAARAESWARVLRREGAEVIVAPLISFEPPADPSVLDDALKRAAGGEHDWIFFTSITAVEQVVQRLSVLGLEVPARAKIGVVGKGTAAALQGAGISVDKVPELQTGLGLLATLTDQELDGTAILVPRAAGGREELPRGARARGAKVEVVDAYRTVESGEGAGIIRERLQAGELDVLVLASPSQVRALLKALGSDRHLLDRCLVACIGPTTLQAAVEAGLAAVVAQRPEAEDLVELLAAVVERKG